MAGEERNVTKNRYSNIKPYDLTRVKISLNPDDDSDYINASWIPVGSIVIKCLIEYNFLFYYIISSIFKRSVFFVRIITPFFYITFFKLFIYETWF